MGVILDTCILIDAERRGQSVPQFLKEIRPRLRARQEVSFRGPVQHIEAEVGLSVVTIAELTHGAYREKRNLEFELMAHGVYSVKNLGFEQVRRFQFIEVLSQAVPVYPVTEKIARGVGAIGAALAQKGINPLPDFEDLAIGATALELGFSVATKNVKHFQPIAELSNLEIITW